MSVFNPKIIDASIRDVTSGLADDQKADVLLRAMEHLPIERSRVLIENAVQACLLISNLSPANAAKARLMRAKARLAAGLRMGAHQDLQAILSLQPEHPEACSLMQEHVGNAGKALADPHAPPAFSTEVWREIVRWLPPHDLKSLLLVPHVLSRLASELLFQHIDLHFASDKWESQRSADILTRIILDPAFAKHVKTLRLFFQARDVSPMSFQTGMLANALPKLTNLKNVHCSMRWRDMVSFMRTLETVKVRLRGLSLVPSDGVVELRFPRLKHITQFAFSSKGGSPNQVHDFITQNKTSLRSIVLQNLNWTFPSESLSIRNLTYLDFLGHFPVDSHVFTDIFANGHQLESLRLQCVLECTASAQFRQDLKALPFLRHFAFTLLGYSVNDLDLFPAISDFLRDRKTLQTLHLTVPSAEWAQRRLGYDATVWGVLPSLVALRSLTATLPRDVAAAVAMWLVPRSVRALSLQAATSANPLEFVSQLRAGLPPGLRFIGLAHFQIEDPAAVVQHFPMVRVARIEDSYYTVAPAPGPRAVALEEWPLGRMQHNVKEWLDSAGCEDAEWRGPHDFP